MSYRRTADPGSLSRWKRNVSTGVKRSHRQCPACGRRSNGGTHRFPEERLAVWQCRYCHHEVARTW